jgi:hypothetical protein
MYPWTPSLQVYSDFVTSKRQVAVIQFVEVGAILVAVELITTPTEEASMIV